ncbi:spliceosome-associated protein CWC27 homolog [Caerostris extrusa]|uniref:Peptidyl-prolyl cis-trans isomerase n=1 Tax=Caerostris extrusa TaxID=172846 RepID=A0AAV4V7C1_CAEEX|nr:spliceosome-associated protein CWC27 homolog [Caerostris extrusa]
MSNIYIQEPPTNGKILLHTTVGDLDIELWSKEAPKACRNFVQLCLEGYYEETSFHRLVKGFIVQGGDPLGDGTGGESIYGHPFKDEFHSRLRFVRRGLVAMANSGKDDNGTTYSHTIPPKTSEKLWRNCHLVTGNTLYNMLKLEDGLVDMDDKPLYPHKIISTKVLSNPFPDIEPRVLVKEKKLCLRNLKKKFRMYITLFISAL